MAQLFELPYPFTEAESKAAHDDWGANCGPNALAVCLGKTLDQIRCACEEAGFSHRRNYMSPTMMQEAIRLAGARITRRSDLRWATHGLDRIQWTGPWTAAGSNPKWAYCYTHWVHSRVLGTTPYVFDCNGGWRTIDSWREDIRPLLTNSIQRADGGWKLTHSWEIEVNAQ